MKKLVLIVVLLLAAGAMQAGDFAVYEANYPNVKDYNVNIDEATLVVHRRGVYIELNLYMTVSYDFESWFFKNYNELEFLWEFSLAEQAIMHEFWVWYGDSILAAEMLDKWTAELLFSDVSSPVRNPGLLTQSAPDRDGQVHYELKLFPIKRNEKKRFKIQYLLPARPSTDALRVWLPTTQLISEKSNSIDSLLIIYKYKDNPAAPEIVGTTLLSGEHKPESSAWLVTIPLEYDQFVEMILPSPITDRFYFSAYEQNGENFYHLAVYPPEVTKVERPRRILIAIDFNRFNTAGLDGEFLLSSLKETIQQAFSEQDSINLLISYDDIVQGAAQWVGCSDENVDMLFSRAMKRSFPSYSYFQPLMAKAAAFLDQRADSAELVLFTNTDEISLSNQNKEQLADEIVAMFKPGTKLHFIDLENKSRLIYASSQNYETQLQSFYGRMSYATGGNLFFLRYYPIKTILGAFFYEEISHFERVEVQMRFQEGYAHSKHLMALNEGYYPLHFPIMQVGKFTGSLPIDVKILGKTRMQKVEKELTITEDDISPGSSPQLVTSWYGEHIQSLLRYPYSPVTINDIINLSIEQEILTPYTGFLFFLPDEKHSFCADCTDETVLTDIELSEVEQDSTVEITAYPNPFNSHVLLHVQAPDLANFKLRIYNILGHTIRELDLSGSATRKKTTIKWDGRDTYGQVAPTGVYFAVLTGPNVRKSVKLLAVK